MKHEEYIKRVADEKTQDDKLAHGPPYFECRYVSQVDNSDHTVFKLQTRRDVINLFPWTENLVTVCESNFDLKMINGHEVIKIRREV